MSKQQLGQFYTTRYQYILQGMQIPNKVSRIIEPFAGKGDLLSFIPNPQRYTIEAYDIAPKHSSIVCRDTFIDPPDYTDAFVLTNPPYLARNKSNDKTVFDTYQQNDLYKCFLSGLAKSECVGGIVIVPLNFFCSIRKNDVDLRRSFLTTFYIDQLNIFEEQVFDDTTYTVCSFMFSRRRRHTRTSATDIPTTIYPSNTPLRLQLDETNDYTIGGEIYQLPINDAIYIGRATKDTGDELYLTNIVLKCIDDSADHRLGFQVVDDDDRFIDETPKSSARSYATLTTNIPLSLEKQRRLVQQLNTFIEENRVKYHSLFLTNYRESKTIARKRISFDLAFRITNYILSTTP